MGGSPSGAAFVRRSDKRIAPNVFEKKSFTATDRKNWIRNQLSVFSDYVYVVDLDYITHLVASSLAKNCFFTMLTTDNTREFHRALLFTRDKIVEWMSCLIGDDRPVVYVVGLTDGSKTKKLLSRKDESRRKVLETLSHGL